MTATHQAAPTAQYFPALDGLRALSVLAVVWHHAHPTDLTHVLSTRGYLGVDVFFVISGFLITTLLCREQETKGRVSLPRFWMRRALRLTPLWYAILGVLAVVFLFVVPDAPMAAAFWHDLPWNVTYTSDLIIPGTFLALSWSLAIEEQFYVLWPLIWAKVPSAAMPVLAFLGGGSIAIHLGLFDAVFLEWFGPEWHQLLALRATVLPLVLGCALGLAPGFTARIARPWLALPWLGAIILIAMAPPEVTHSQMRLAAQLAAAGLVAACASPTGPQWLSVRPLRWIGERAYGVYLLHLFCLQLLGSVGPWRDGHRDMYAFLVVFALSLVAAGLSYRWLEQPFLGLKRRFR